MSGRLRLTRRAFTVATLCVEGGFVTAILVLRSPPVQLHEIAGGALWALLAIALGCAIANRRADPRPVLRLVAALLVLIATGATGAALAAAALSSTLSWVPLLLLLLLAALLLDSLRSSMQS